jgi:hypothetical protein
LADTAHAAEVYAKRQKASQETIDYAHGVKVDAMTLLGEFLSRQEKQAGAPGKAGPGKGKRGAKVEPRLDAPPTLAEAGISKKESAAPVLQAAFPGWRVCQSGPRASWQQQAAGLAPGWQFLGALARATAGYSASWRAVRYPGMVRLRLGPSRPKSGMRHLRISALYAFCTPFEHRFAEVSKRRQEQKSAQHEKPCARF